MVWHSDKMSRGKGSTGPSDSGLTSDTMDGGGKGAKGGKQKYTYECQPGSRLDSELPLYNNPSSSDPSMGGDSLPLGGNSLSPGDDSLSQQWLIIFWRRLSFDRK